MIDQPVDFYLSSSEGYDLGNPRKCYRIKRLQGDTRDDYLLIRIDPPLIGQEYGLGGQDIDEVIVAARYKGDSLFPIVEWPAFVHVARILVDNPGHRDIIHSDELEEIAWAELYETYDAARNKTM